MGKCKFRTDWMFKKDKNGDLLSSWVSRLSEVAAICKLCASTVDFKNKGFHAFLQHSGTDNHQKLVKNNKKQMVFIAGTSEESSSQLDPSADNGERTNSNPAQIKLYSPRNAATISELIWVMKSVCCNFSAASCRNIKDTFDAMFPEAVPKDFSLSPKKMNYLITDALGPYFYQMMVEDVGDSFFTICFDETTNVEDKKELQVTIRYWSKAKDEVISRHLQTYFIGKADAQILYEKISCAISNANLLLQKLLMVGSDGPYVNKKVHKLFNENLVEIRSFPLTDVGTCPIHIVHNAYLKALQAFGEDSSELVVAIFHYFDGWPARCEDYEKIQENLGLPLRKFLKHSPSRWLTFRYAAERLLEQWEGIIYYFQKFIPSKKNDVVQSTSFKKISNLIRIRTVKAEMHFAMSSADLFMNFTETFQKDEPLVHMLYLKLQELIEKLARRVCKHVSESNYDELFQTQNILPLKDIVVSQDVKKELMHLPEKDILLFMRNVKDHYVAGCSHLIEKSLSNTALIKSLKCLSPVYLKNKKSCRDIVSIARKLPINIKEDILIDEFKILQLEATDSSNENERIDHYWRKLLNKKNEIGQKKYAEIEKVVKVALSLSHGNANIERRFSVSRSALTDEKASTSERTFNAIMTIKDALKTFSNKPELVPMTSKLISMGQSAHKCYIMYMEEQKRLKKIEEEKKNEEICLAAKEKERLEKAEESRKKINQFEDKISKSKKEHEIASEASDRLFKEANNRLKSALQKGDMSEVSVAQGMLEGILSIRKTEQEKLREVVKLQNNIQKRKDTIISTFCAKKPKMT